MVALPTLYPATPDGTATTMSAPVGAATYAEAIQTNDGGTSYVTAGVDSAGNVFVNLDDTPADFETMDSLTVSCVVRLEGTVTDDTTALYAQVFAADETTALTDEVFVTDQATGNTYTTDSTALVLSAAGTTATKADWDGARLRLRWEYVKTRASDAIALHVTQSYLDGAYTASGPTQPVANAGPYQIAAYGSTVTLDATASTGGELSYSWEQISGTAVTLTGATTANPTFTAPSVRDQLVFRVTTTNSIGTSTDDVIVGTAGVTIRTREQWRADESKMTQTATHYAFTHSTIHHTDTLSTDITDFDQFVRDLYHTHSVTNGWGDLGYHFLIAPDGTIYEGRYAGNDGDAAHNSLGELVTATHNPNRDPSNLGIAFILDGDVELPPQAAIDSTTALLGDFATRHNWNPQEIADYVNNATATTTVDVQRVTGYIDWGDAGVTSPGVKVHPYLPHWRREAARTAGQTVLPPQRAKLLNLRIPDTTYNSKPWLAANGNWYMFMIPAANLGHVQAMQSPDGIVWHPVGAVWAKGNDAIDALISIPRGDGLIDVWVQDISRDVSHNIWDATADTWGGGTLVTSEPTGTRSYISGAQRSDGMQFVQVTDTPLAGGEQQVRGIRRVGTTFYHHSTYDGSEVQNFFVGPTVLGDADRMHLLFNTDNASAPRYYHRAWTTAETFPARDVVDNSPYVQPGPVTDTNGAVRVGTDIWTVYVDAGGMALKRFISQDNITPNSDELISTSIMPDFTNDVPRINLAYSSELNELLVTYMENGVINLARYSLTNKAWGTTTVISSPGTGLAQMPVWDGAALLVFYRPGDGDAQFSGNYVTREAVLASASMSANSTAATTGTATTSGAATISGAATTSIYIYEPPAATAGPMQIGMLFNEGFYGETTGVQDSTAKIVASSTGSLSVSASAATTGAATIASTASTLTVAFAEKFGQAPLDARGTQSTSATVAAQAALAVSGTSTLYSTAYVESSAALTAHSEALTQVVVLVESTGSSTASATASVTVASGTEVSSSTNMLARGYIAVETSVESTSTASMSANAYAQSDSETGTSGTVSIAGVGSQLIVTEAEKFGTLTAPAIATQTTASDVETTGGVAVSGAATFVSSAQVETGGALTLSGIASTTVIPSVEATSTSSMNAAATTSVSSYGEGEGALNLIASSTFSSTAAVSTTGQVAIEGVGSNLVVAEAEKFGSLSAIGLSDVIVDAGVDSFAAVTGTGLATTTTSPLVTTSSGTTMLADGSLTIVESITSPGSLTVRGESTTTAVGWSEALATSSPSALARLKVDFAGMVSGEVAISGVGSKLIVAEAEKFGELTAIGRGTQSATASASTTASLGLSATSTKTITTTVTSYGTSVITTSGDMVTSGVGEATSGTSFVAVAAVQAVGLAEFMGALSISALGSVVSDGLAETSAAAAIEGTGSKLVVAEAEKFGVLALTGAALTTAAATVAGREEIHLHGTSSATTIGIAETSGALALTVNAIQNTVPAVEASGAVLSEGVAVTTVAALSGSVGGASLTGTSTLSAASSTETFGTIVTESTASQLIVAFEEKFASVSVSGSAALAGQGAGTSLSAALMDATSSTTISGTREFFGSVIADASATTTMVAVHEHIASSAQRATSTFSASATQGFFASASIEGVGSYLAVGFGEKFGQIALRSAALFATDATAGGEGRTDARASASASISGTRAVVAQITADTYGYIEIAYTTKSVARVQMTAQAVMETDPKINYHFEFHFQGYARLNVVRPTPVPQLDSRSDIGTLIGASSDRNISIEGSSSRGGVIIESA